MSLDKVYLQMLYEEVMPRTDAFMDGMLEFEKQLREYYKKAKKSTNEQVSQNGLPLAEDDFMSGMEEFEWLSSPVYYNCIEFFPPEREALISSEMETLDTYLNRGFLNTRLKTEFLDALKTKGYYTDIHPTDTAYWEYTTDKERHKNNLARYKKMAAHRKYKLIGADEGNCITEDDFMNGMIAYENDARPVYVVTVYAGEWHAFHQITSTIKAFKNLRDTGMDEALSFVYDELIANGYSESHVDRTTSRRYFLSEDEAKDCVNFLKQEGYTSIDEQGNFIVEDDFMSGIEEYERQAKPFFIVYCYPIGRHLRICTGEYRAEQITSMTIGEHPGMLDLFLSTGRAEFNAYSQSTWAQQLYTKSEEDAAAFAAKLADLAQNEGLTPRFIEI